MPNICKFNRSNRYILFWNSSYIKSRVTIHNTMEINRTANVLVPNNIAKVDYTLHIRVTISKKKKNKFHSKSPHRTPRIFYRGP